MKTVKPNIFLIACLFTLLPLPGHTLAWHDETHLAIAKAAGYYKWYNAAGADTAKIKAGKGEAHNHFSSNSPRDRITSKSIFKQVEKYNRVDEDGHLYGAIIASVRDYMREKRRGKYAEYHLAFCAHYVGDLSQPLHNTLSNEFNRTYHVKIDGLINREALRNLHKIKLYPIGVDSETDLVREIARIANLSKDLGYKIERQNRPLTKGEVYAQINNSASLFRAILGFVPKLR